MSVTDTSFNRISACVCVIALLLTAPLAASARQARVIISKASQLADDPAVRKFVEPYRLLSSANVIYAKCDVELEIGDTQKHYVAAEFSRVSNAYMQAFDEAFRARTGTASPKKMVHDYYRHLLTAQKAAAINMARVVKNNSCADSQIRDIVRYYDTVQKQGGETVPVNQPSPAADAPPAD